MGSGARHLAGGGRAVTFHPAARRGWGAPRSAGSPWDDSGPVHDDPGPFEGHACGGGAVGGHEHVVGVAIRKDEHRDPRVGEPEDRASSHGATKEGMPSQVIVARRPGVEAPEGGAAPRPIP